MDVTDKDSSSWAERFAGATRDMYRETLQELADGNTRIMCLDSDMGGLETGFGAALPGQYIDVGIAEANLVSVAAGLAHAGKIPFVNTMAGFASARACEQVKIDVAYNNLPVKIVGSHAGVSAGHLGPTHHSLEDVAIMRSLANMTVIVPADTVETRKAVTAAAETPGPVYIRLGRRPTGLVHWRDYDFMIGKAVSLRAGSDITLIATGPLAVLRALEAAEALARQGVESRVLNMHTLKPLDTDSLLAAARETNGIVTVEQHSVIGGLGSAVAEILGEQAPCPMRRIGARDTFVDTVGNEESLLRHLGITQSAVENAVWDILQ